ncbi:amidohydrolase family protein [Herbiconiux sp.]|uniref:amidohydrolase n=1 Tax=Herbiconiux sp. TaxID=1871186 RepID=UPI0025C45612|nr:amidohydrolase family protein [Herbiconiux sp.]
MSEVLVLTGGRMPGAVDLVDVTIIDGIVAAIEPARSGDPSHQDAQLIALDGRWVVPGLWDNHVHFSQWAAASRRLDVSAARSAAETVALVAAALRRATHSVSGAHSDAGSSHRSFAAASGTIGGAPGTTPRQTEPAGGGADARVAPLVGVGFRDGLWPDEPTAALLDAVTGPHPVVLISGDLHCCWLNSAALAQTGLAGHPTGLLREEEAFAVHRALDEVPAEVVDAWALDSAQAAAARGVVGIVDLEMAWNHEVWTRRLAAGHDLLRVEFGVYPHHLDRAITEGIRTGTPVSAPSDRAGSPVSAPSDRAGSPASRGGFGSSVTAPRAALAGGASVLVHVGPFKVITDGSLNTRTAYCFDEYPGLEGQPGSRGLLTTPPDELRALLTRAVAAGFVPAVHAIGDHANRLALDAFEELGCGGSLEHAQLVSESDFGRFAALGVTASVQPEHAMDDRDVAERYWSGRTGRSFALASLLEAGAVLAMGSDAPVAPLDPWVTMAAAIGRARDGREPWHPEQSIAASAALAASARGRTSSRVGDVADIAVTELDPLATPPDALRTMPVALTLLAGRPTHRTL